MRMRGDGEGRDSADTPSSYAIVCGVKRKFRFGADVRPPALAKVLPRSLTGATLTGMGAFPVSLEKEGRLAMRMAALAVREADMAART